MTKLRLTGWRDGIQSVSLAGTLSQHVGSLTEAKCLLEKLLDGDEVELSFETDEDRELFRAKVESLGVLTK
jgi:hypothetical protein